MHDSKICMLATLLVATLHFKLNGYRTNTEDEKCISHTIALTKEKEMEKVVRKRKANQIRKSHSLF